MFKPIIFGRSPIQVTCSSFTDTQYDYWLDCGQDFRHLRIEATQFQDPLKVYTWLISDGGWEQASYSNAIFDGKRAFVLVESDRKVLMVKTKRWGQIWDELARGLSEHRNYQLSQFKIPAGDLQGQS